MEVEGSEGLNSELEAELKEAKPPPEPPPMRDKFKGGAEKKIEEVGQNNEAENNLENCSFTMRYTVKEGA
eukprot:565631-Alexandrium_andersonii.AAC.1